MSQAEQPVSASALGIQEQAATWLARTIGEAWSGEDQAALDDWLAASNAHKLAYWRLRAAWQRTDRLSALRPAFGRFPASPHYTWRIVGAVAAVVVVAAGFVAMGGLSLSPPPKFQEFSTPIGGRQLLTLGDGTRIELNTDTAVRIAVSGSERAVVLERGEAYFDVRHDARRPLVVTAGSHRVVDLGTKFLVRDDPKQLRVTLVEGRARLESAKAYNQALLLAPGDVAVATATTMSVTRAPASIAPELGWRRGLLIFDNASLEAVASEFNRYNKTKLIVADDSTAKLTIGGTFQANDVRTFAQIARTLLNLKVKDSDREILISR